MYIQKHDENNYFFNNTNKIYSFKNNHLMTDFKRISISKRKFVLNNNITNEATSI